MGITSKEIIIVFIGLMASIILAFILKLEKSSFGGFQEKDFIVILMVSIVAIIVIVYMKINEVNKELDIQKEQQQKLIEKLKIYEQLINMKVEIKELQKKVFKR